MSNLVSNTPYSVLPRQGIFLKRASIKCDISIVAVSFKLCISNERDPSALGETLPTCIRDFRPGP